MSLNCLKKKIGCMVLCVAPTLLVASEDQNKQSLESRFDQECKPAGQQATDLQKTPFSKDALLQKIRNAEWTVPSVEEVAQMDPADCQRIIEALYETVSTKSGIVINEFTKEPISTFSGWYRPCTCQSCNGFETEVQNLPAGDVLAQHCRIMHSAYLAAAAFVRDGMNCLGTFDKQRARMLQNLQSELRKVEGEHKNLSGVREKRRRQLQELEQTQQNQAELDSPQENSESPEIELMDHKYPKININYFANISQKYNQLTKYNEMATIKLRDIIKVSLRIKELNEINATYRSQLAKLRSALQDNLNGLIEDLEPGSKS